MIIIFDYDHTIFDMMAMHEEIVGAMKELGVSERAYQDAYAQVTNWKMFTPDAMAQRLHRIAGVKPPDVLDAFNSIAEHSGKYVYPDTVKGFESLKNAGHELYILSWGDKAWQMKKIKQSKLLPFCKEVLSVSQLKADYLKGWAPDGIKVVLVDDKPAELKAVDDLHLGIHLIRMRRPGAKYSDQPTPLGMAEAQNMEGVLKTVESL